MPAAIYKVEVARGVKQKCQRTESSLKLVDGPR